jgi:hypothetical protein
MPFMQLASRPSSAGVCSRFAFTKRGRLMSYLLSFLAGTVCGYVLNTIRAHRNADRAAIERRLANWAG